MARSLRGKPTETPAVVVLPVAGLAPDDHVADEDGLEGLSHAFRREPAGKPPGKADVESGNLLEPSPALADPLQIVDLQSFCHEHHGLSAVAPRGARRPVAVR